MSKKSRPWGRRARARIRKRTEAGPRRVYLRMIRMIEERGAPVSFDGPVFFNGIEPSAWEPLTAESLEAELREIDRLAPAPEPLEYTEAFRRMGLPPDLMAGGAPVFGQTPVPGATWDDDAQPGEVAQIRFGPPRRNVVDVEVVQRALPPIPKDR